MSIRFFLPCEPPKSTGNNTKRIKFSQKLNRPIFFKSAKTKENEAFYDKFKQFVPSVPLSGPIKVGVVFIFPYNKSDLATKNKRAELARNPYLWHTSKPDADNILKTMFDCMTRLGFWEDDKNIVTLHVCKLRSAKTGILMEIIPIGTEPNMPLDLYPELEQPTMHA